MGGRRNSGLIGAVVAAMLFAACGGAPATSQGDAPASSAPSTASPSTEAATRPGGPPNVAPIRPLGSPPFARSGPPGAPVSPETSASAVVGASAAPQAAAPAAAPAAAAAPTLTALGSPTQVKGASLWLFAVPDGGVTVALSAETSGQIVAGRLDPGSPAAPVAWKVVASAADTGGSAIADHWHVFAHDAHWIVFSVTSADRSWLVKLDRDFNRLGIFPVATKGSGLVTNDMFMVPEADGVAVAQWRPGFGQRMFHFGVDGTLRGTTDVGGGIYTSANGASAAQTASGFLLLAPQSLNPQQYSAIRAISTDAGWRPTSASSAIAEPTTNIAMASGVNLTSGYWIVDARVRSGVAAEGQQAPPPPPGSSDDGDLVRYVLTPGLAIASRTQLGTHANRPHTSLFGSLLITTWDSGGAVWLRLDRVAP